MLEVHALKEQLQNNRQLLASSLYAQDASARVIARLTKERDALLKKLEDLSSSTNSGRRRRSGEEMENGQDAEAEEGGHKKRRHDDGESMTSVSATMIPPDLQQIMSAKGKELSEWRRHRPRSEGLAVPSAFGTYGHHALGASSLPSPLTELQLLPSGYLALASAGDLYLSSTSTSTSTEEKVIQAMTLPRSGLHQLVPAPSSSASTLYAAWCEGPAANKKTWSVGVVDNVSAAASSASSSPLTVSAFTLPGVISKLAAHPVSPWLCTAYSTGDWSMHDMAAQTTIVSAPAAYAPNAGGFAVHPDGMLLAEGGSDGLIRIWDLKGQNSRGTVGIACQFEGHTAGIQSLNFSVNGYVLISQQADGDCWCWDLRKLKAFKKLERAGKGKGRSGRGNKKNVPTPVALDESGHYFAACDQAGTIDVYETKQWQIVHSWESEKKNMTKLVWGNDALSLYSATVDGELWEWHP